MTNIFGKIYIAYSLVRNAKQAEKAGTDENRRQKLLKMSPDTTTTEQEMAL